MRIVQPPPLAEVLEREGEDEVDISLTTDGSIHVALIRSSAWSAD
jgi:hypothetical protein